MCKSLSELKLQDGDKIRINLKTGEIANLHNGIIHSADPFSDVQYQIYQKGGLLG
jgi:hypothetical protein